jgi:uncharacterized glyoxalase superfamily protein PhnB
MSNMPTGTNSVRSFLPRKDFDISKRFHEFLGFKIVLDSVDDLDAWWNHIVGLDLPRHFGVQSHKPLAMLPWGLGVAYLFDPSGVLWHVCPRRSGADQD